MKTARLLVVSVLIAALPAQASSIDLGLGADYWLYDRYYAGGHGLFSLTFGLRGALARRISLGGRFGGFITTLPYQIGAPIDLQLRAHVGDGRVYIDGLLGPWVVFTSAAPLRFHAAFGFGLQASWVTFGFELGYLDPTAIVGLRVAFRL